MKKVQSQTSLQGNMSLGFSASYCFTIIFNLNSIINLYRLYSFERTSVNFCFNYSILVVYMVVLSLFSSLVKDCVKSTSQFVSIDMSIFEPKTPSKIYFQSQDLTELKVNFLVLSQLLRLSQSKISLQFPIKNRH